MVSASWGRPRGLRMEVRGVWHAHYITAWKGGDSSVPFAQGALDDGNAAISRPMGVRGRRAVVAHTDGGALVLVSPTGVRCL